jgi:hypothetical protein
MRARRSSTKLGKVKRTVRVRPKYAPAEAEYHIVKATNPFLLQESDMRIRAQSPRNKAAVPFEDIIGYLQVCEDGLDK